MKCMRVSCRRFASASSLLSVASSRECLYTSSLAALSSASYSELVFDGVGVASTSQFYPTLSGKACGHLLRAHSQYQGLSRVPAHFSRPTAKETLVLPHQPVDHCPRVTIRELHPSAFLVDNMQPRDFARL